MPFNVGTLWERQALPRPEILSYPVETNVIDSVVINSAGVAAAGSASPYAGRRYLVAGTILSVRQDTQYEQYTGAEGQVVSGILFDTVEFADATAASDEPAAILRRNASFRSDNIVDYETHADALGSALPTCEFV